LKNLNKWFEGIASNASFKKYFGRLFYCSKEWEVVSIEPQEKKVEEVKKEEHVKAAKKPKKNQKMMKTKIRFQNLKKIPLTAYHLPNLFCMISKLFSLMLLINKKLVIFFSKISIQLVTLFGTLNTSRQKEKAKNSF